MTTGSVVHIYCKRRYWKNEDGEAKMEKVKYRGELKHCAEFIEYQLWRGWILEDKDLK
jgi:hypothetical protein